MKTLSVSVNEKDIKQQMYNSTITVSIIAK